MPESVHEFPYHANIVYVIDKDNRVLLQKKAKGFGAGNWNGPGGKLKPGELPIDSARRELEEETSLKAIELEQVAELELIFSADENSNNYGYVFICRSFEGEPIDTGEGELRWFSVDEIPYDKMWDDDRYWVPLVLRGEKLHMRFVFDKNGKVIEYKNLPPLPWMQGEQ